ncbi:hypothetical protein ACFFNY_01595 [Paenibacillus hodogayensis]|uniref:DUF11 domain-containing protein n=1 Tax=Paenibacillus hodogayensis TaxID=279208 RepID=A0ABV5VPQ3_9BACL
MKKTFRMTVATSLISVMLGVPGAAVFAASDVGATSVSAPQAAVYALSEQLKVEMKSVLNERQSGGSRVGVVLRLSNTGSAATRLADYELLVRTRDGAEYALEPSAANAKSVQPKTSAELSFLAEIDRTDGVELAEVLLKEVDYYVYPKKETLLLSIPVVSRPWNGSEGVAAADPSVTQAWGESFSFPTQQSPITYKPVSVRKDATDKGAVYVVQLLASNPTDRREPVPDFAVDGRSANKVFAGSRVEQGPLALEAKEDTYIHYAIPTDTDTILTGFNVLTAETFLGAAGSAPVSYKVGRLRIDWSPGSESGSYPAYTFGNVIETDANNTLIHPDLRLSLVELPISDNAEEGSRTVTATFVLTNNGDSPIPIPVFQTSLLSSGGYRYDGSRQTAGGAPLLPKESVPIHYAFTLPVAETGQGLVLKIEDAVTAAPYKTTIAGYRLDAVPYEKRDQFAVYPFRLGVRTTSTNFVFNPQTMEYAYIGNYDLSIEREPGVRVDAAFPSLLFELYDGSDRLVASSTNPLAGAGRLVAGSNKIRFAGTTQNFDYPLTLKIYETFPTEAGQSKRLLTQMEQ